MIVNWYLTLASTPQVLLSKFVAVLINLTIYSQMNTVKKYMYIYLTHLKVQFKGKMISYFFTYSPRKFERACSIQTLEANSELSTVKCSTLSSSRRFHDNQKESFYWKWRLLISHGSLQAYLFTLTQAFLKTFKQQSKKQSKLFLLQVKLSW